MISGKCPSCDQLVLSLNLHGLDDNGAGGAWQAITLQCPRCNVVLGAQIDPIALKTDTVDQTVKKLKGY